ncbi:carbohydrate-binding domain-containing protein [Ruminococcus sp.]|uniref:carbohydrate-binding domain-containing protein n=1 Tax=Ruminococcus sp. TaxID=41978 RepID=UPI003F07E7ED
MKVKNAFLASVLSALLITASLPIASAANSDEAVSSDAMILGDADGDGLVAINDATLIQRHTAEFGNIPDERKAAADVNADDCITVADATLIQKYLAEIATEYAINEPIGGGDIQDTTATEATEDTTATSPTDAVDEDAWKSNTGQIILSNSGITVSGDGISVDGNIVTISDGGDWEVIGTCDDGMIYVNTGEIKDDNDKVKLRLNGMSLTNTSGPAIYFDRCKKAFITIESGSENYISDSPDYAADYSEAKGAIHSDDSLEIKGKGTLNVTGNYSHAVNSDDDILIENGVINILSSVKDGLHANDAIDIIGKNIVLTTNTTGDAVESEGYLTVDAATLNFTAGAKGLSAADYITLTDVNATMNTDNDCINSNAAVTVSGGTYDLESGDDGITGLAIDIESGTFDMETTGKGLNDDEGNTITTGDFTIDSTDDCINSNGAVTIYDGTFELESDDDAITGDTIGITGGTFILNTVGKGIKSTTDTTLKDGNYTINSTDDALHTNGNITIDGGTYTITSGDDGVHADTTLTINDCILTITKSYEGLEGCDVIINGGTISVVSSDDGINAAGGNDSSSQNTRPGGQGGSQFNPGTSSNSSIQINGGYISVVASGDGIDSNGALTFAGGVTLVQDLTNGGDFAIDADSTITFSGGIVMAVCSSNAMWQDITGKLSDGAVINQSVGTVSTSTVFAVKDSSDNVLSALQSKVSGNVGVVYYNSSSTAGTVSTGGSYSGTLDDFGYGSGGSYTGGSSYTLSASSSSGGGNLGPGGRY